MKHRTRLQRLETALQRTDEALTIAVTWIDAEGATVAEIPPAPVLTIIDYRVGLVGATIDGDICHGR